MLKVMTVSETKEYHHQRLERLCKESIAKGMFYHEKDYKFSPTLTERERKERQRKGMKMFWKNGRRYFK